MAAKDPWDVSIDCLCNLDTNTAALGSLSRALEANQLLKVLALGLECVGPQEVEIEAVRGLIRALQHNQTLTHICALVSTGGSSFSLWEWMTMDSRVHFEICRYLNCFSL